MTDVQDRRSKFFDDRDKTVAVYEARSFEYEKIAIECANSAFKILMYLNGGALVAIPAALALLNWKTTDHKIEIIRFAALFVLGLVAVLLSQMFAFFTMARRSEAQQFLANQQSWHSSLVHYPEQFDLKETKAKADKAGSDANAKIATSNVLRIIAIVFAWVSAFAFIGGCIYAAYAMGS